MTTLSTRPLPPAPSLRPDYLKTYDIILNAERHAVQQVENSSSDQGAKQNLIYARVVGYLLLELFDRRMILSDGPCESLVKQLTSLPRESGDPRDVVFRVGKLHRDSLLRMFRTSARKYPTPSMHSSRASFDTLEDMTRDHMMSDNKDYRTARRKALARDGFRCMLTGMFDDASLEHNRRLDQLCHDLGATSTTVQACHILNELTMRGIDPTGSSEKGAVTDETQYAISAMSIPRRFGLESLARELLKTDDVHNLGNLLSLGTDAHTRFANLQLWFEGTDKPNCYTVGVSRERHERFLRMFGHLHADGNHLSVTFTSNYENAQLPNPQLLALHATCARVAHMSGAAEAFDELDRGVEDARVLAFDGSSAHLLNHLMASFAVVPGVT